MFQCCVVVVVALSGSLLGSLPRPSPSPSSLVDFWLPWSLCLCGFGGCSTWASCVGRWRWVKCSTVVHISFICKILLSYFTYKYFPSFLTSSKLLYNAQKDTCMTYGTKCEIHYLECHKSICKKLQKILVTIWKYFDSEKNENYTIHLLSIVSHCPLDHVHLLCQC